jgi:fumarate hydratase subunit beta
VSLPLQLDVSAGSDVAALRAGDRVRITGTMYVVRDRAAARLAMLDAAGRLWPFAVERSVVYRMTPLVAPRVARLDPALPMLVAHGVGALVGTARRSPSVRRLLTDHGVVYLTPIGGLGTMLAHTVRSWDIAAFGDLGIDAIRRLEVVNFPAFVALDRDGDDVDVPDAVA